MKKIPLKYGGFTLVDDEDYEYLNQWKWWEHSKGYAASGMGRGGRTCLLHRIVMAAQNGQQIDHINHDKLDNRKCNLRICNNSQNHMNIKKYAGKSSKFKGVYYDKSRNRWAADIKLNKQKIRLGRFKNELEAALAYNVAARRYFGPFAYLNQVPE